MTEHGNDDHNPFAAPDSDLAPREFESRSDEPVERGHHIIDAGDVISTSWTIFKTDMGLVIGGVIVFNILNFAAQLPQMGCDIAAAQFENQGDTSTALLFRSASLLALVFNYACQIYLMCGVTQFLLNVVRGEASNVSDLFSGGRFFWRMAGAWIVYGIFVGIGFLACIIPGIYVALMFCTFAYPLIDDDTPGIDSLWRAKDMTKDNILQLLVIFLAAFGINILGFLALIVGAIFTVPLTALFLAVAYCKMTGQKTIGG